jgi:plasmid stabilization system protein ParE
MKPVVFDSEAKDEFDAAASYYEGQQAGLGDAFVAAVEEATQRIAQLPQAFAIHGPSGLRKCVLRRFPYTLFFLEQEDRIWIAAVAHQRRRPGYWSHRKPD